MAGLLESDEYRAFCSGQLDDPYPLLARLREDHPVHWSPIAQSWIVTRYDGVAAVLQHDPRLTANRLDRLLSQLPQDNTGEFAPLRDHMTSFVGYHDPPEHARLRAAANRPFTPRPIQAMETRVGEIVDQLLAELEQTAEPDLIRDFAYPLPAIVIMELLGVPTADRDQIRGWADILTRFMEGVGDHLVTDARATTLAVEEFSAYLRREIAARPLESRDDLIGILMAELSEGRLTESELFGWCMFLLQAGHETTTGLIGNGLVTLLEHSDQLASLRENPDLTDSAVEELLRFDSPIQRISRIALDDVEIDNVHIPKGSRVWAMLGAANRDPEQFPDPDRLDLGRRPNRHLAFGYSIHFCLGAPLARLEGRLAIRALVDRYPEIALDGTPRRWEGVSLHRFSSLPIRLRGVA
jgi:cytochrome P450